MNVSEKKTALDDSAAIYHPREERTEREKWKELKGFRAKWTYFKSYYLRNLLFAVAGIAVIGYILYSTLKPQRERELFIAFLDGVMLDNVVEDLQIEYEEYFNLDKEKQEMVFDTTMYLSVKKDTVSAQRFTAYLFAKELDIIIAPESCFREVAGGCMHPLSEQLPEDIYAQQKERFCTAAQLDDNGKPIAGTEQAYGLYVTDLLEVSPFCEEPLVIGVCGNSEHKENAEAFLRYLLAKGK